MQSMLVIDDEYLVRVGIKETIDWSKYGIEIIGEASDGEEGLKLALQHLPDIIITDIRMPFMDGLELMAKIREHNIQSRIIILSGYEEFDYAREAIQNGAIAYLLKPIENETLVKAVQDVCKKIKEDRSTKNYYEKLKGELSSLKKQFLRDIVTGSIKDRAKIEENSRFLDMPLELENNFVVTIRIDNYQEVLLRLGEDKTDEFRKAIVESIAKFLLINKEFNGIFVDTFIDEWVVIVHVNTYMQGFENRIKEYCLDIISEVRQNFDQSISIGISELCHDIENINQEYRKSVEASGFKLIPGNCSVASINERENSCRKEIREALKFINDNFNRDITVEMAAKELFISPSHLMHIFRDELDKTFNDCVLDFRIATAKELLKESRYKVYEICEKVGYNDVKYFSQVFKKYTGFTPSEFIKQK